MYSPAILSSVDDGTKSLDVNATPSIFTKVTSAVLPEETTGRSNVNDKFEPDLAVLTNVGAAD